MLFSHGKWNTTEKARTVVAGNDSERGGSGWLGFAIEAFRDLRFV